MSTTLVCPMGSGLLVRLGQIPDNKGPGLNVGITAMPARCCGCNLQNSANRRDKSRSRLDHPRKHEQRQTRLLQYLAVLNSIDFCFFSNLPKAIYDKLLINVLANIMRELWWLQRYCELFIPPALLNVSID
jgi:hypothetical protein